MVDFYTNVLASFGPLLLDLGNMLVKQGASPIGGGIVNDDHMIVGIVLLDNRVDVEFVPRFLLVVKGRHHDTEGQLFSVVAYSVGGIVVLVLLRC